MNLKKIIKRGFSVGLTVMSLCMAILPVQATSNNNHVDIELQKSELIMGDIVLRDATEEELSMMNSGELAVIEFDSIEELEEYLDQRKAKTIDITDSVHELPPIKPFGLSDVSSRTIGVDPIPIPPVYINCQFNYNSTKNANGQWFFTSISNINSWLTGIQFPVNYSWSQKSGTYSYSNSYRNVRINCSGVLGTHIVVQGVGKILEQNMTYSFDYTARQ